MTELFNKKLGVTIRVDAKTAKKLGTDWVPADQIEGSADNSLVAPDDLVAAESQEAQEKQAAAEKPKEKDTK